ncbi:Gamma-glutamyl cyclotransferase-like [Trinorchestia longiramus]|nr:Gamma-glutamyl cyclotransferase-like [Trinorchestia longiramus]
MPASGAAPSESSDSFLYFAFGSNLLTDRIHINNPSATFVDVAKLEGYKLEFNYYSKRWKGAAATVNPVTLSSSQKGHEAACLAGDFVCTPGHVWGVLWRLNNYDMPHLDSQEGVKLDDNLQHVGVYRPLEVPVVLKSTGETVQARTYQLIRPLEEDRRPSKVYLSVICKGAQEHGLPEEYQKFLQNIEHNGYDQEVDVQLNLKQK